MRSDQGSRGAERSSGTVGSASLPRSVSAALAVLFFFSGALALVYEVLWQRRFTLVFGSSAPATAALLAAFFGGLGLGNLVLGAWAARWRRPLRVYAVLEALIGAGALLVVPLLAGFDRLYPWLFERLAQSPGVFSAVKASAAFVSLVVPTFCMGGTLPVLGRLVDGDRRRLGLSAGLLYVANTAGGVAGALGVPFLLLALGSAGALAISVTGNLCLALIAWRMDHQWAASVTVVPEGARAKQDAEARGSLRPYLVLSLFSGCVAFVLQVLWNRAFAQVHENSAYSFAVIVAVFIVGLAMGAQLARVGLRRAIAPDKLIGWAWLLGGALAAAGPWICLRLTDGLSYLPADGGWTRYGPRLVLLAAAAMLAPVTLLGIGLPAIMEQGGRRDAAATGDVIGRLLAANVIGCVTGALAAGFLMPRLLGLWSGIVLTAAGLAVAGAWQLAPSTRPPRHWFRLGLALALAAASWPISRLALPRVRVAEPEGERLLALSEGTHGIVAVVEGPESRGLKLNNYYLLGGTAAAGDERMQAHIPLILHPSPRRVAALGLGTGITAGAALLHPIEQLEAIELVPDVADAARDYFGAANLGVFEDPRARVVVEDARGYLRGTAARYDVVIGDLVVPWRQGESALFTLENFGAARRVLEPGGLFCQWLPLFQLSERELSIVLRTFLAVFPRAEVWRGDFSSDQPAVALVGRAEALTLDPPAIRRRLLEMRPDPLNSQLAEPIAFWMYFAGILGPEDVPDGEVNSEGHPWIELLGPLRHAGVPGSGLFTGRRLQAWLTQLAARSARWLPRPDAAQLEGMRAGEQMFAFSVALAEGDEEGARSAHDRLRMLLPPLVYRAIFSDVPGAVSPDGP